MKQWISRHLLVAVVVGNIALVIISRWLGWGLEWVVLAGTLATLLIAMVLERLMPHRPAWNRSRGDTATDLTSASVIVAVVDPALKYGGPIAVAAIWKALGVKAPLVDWFALQPFAAQVLAVTLLSEFGRYWAHRWHHTNAWLWKLHALHHNSERLYAFNNFRFHPLNYLNNFLLGVLPLLLIGVPSDAMLGYLAISQPVLMLQHANVDLRSGVLNYVFSTNEVHRWHHSSVPNEAHRNFGYALVLWDLVFGTFRYSAVKNAPRRIGLFAESRAASGHRGYLAQLVGAFHPGCCAART